MGSRVLPSRQSANLAAPAPRRTTISCDPSICSRLPGCCFVICYYVDWLLELTCECHEAGLQEEAKDKRRLDASATSPTCKRGLPNKALRDKRNSADKGRGSRPLACAPAMRTATTSKGCDRVGGGSRGGGGSRCGGSAPKGDGGGCDSNGSRHLKSPAGKEQAPKAGGFCGSMEPIKPLQAQPRRMTATAHDTWSKGSPPKSFRTAALQRLQGRRSALAWLQFGV